MVDLKENIANMTDEEIKERILELNKEQLQLIKKASHFIGYSQILSQKEKLEDIESYLDSGSHKELNLLERYLENIIVEFSRFNSQQTHDKKPIEELIEKRKSIGELAAMVAGYQIELSYVGELVDEHGIKLLCEQDYKNAGYDKRRIDDLISYIMMTLDNYKNDYHKYISIVSEIILILPMRLVKNNYFDILKESILRSSRNISKLEVDNKLEDFKKQFDSSILDGYGTKFDYYFREIQKLKNTDLTNMKLEDLDEFVKEIMKNTNEMNSLYEYIFTLGLIFNKIIVINQLEDIPLGEDMENIRTFWKATLDGTNNINDFKKEIENKILEVENNMYSSLDEFNMLNNEAFNREDFNFDELAEELNHTRRVLAIYNDMHLSDYDKMIEIGDQLASFTYTEQRCDALIQYISRSIVKMNNVERKIRMRRLLSLVELPFDGMEGFTDYIRYSLDNRVLSEKEINFKIDYILYFLEELEGQKN